MKSLRFALPSLLGVAMFLAPYPTADGFNIGLGILTDRAGALLGDRLPAITVAIVCLSALVSLYAALVRPAWSSAPKGLAALFAVSRASVAVRAVAAVLACMVLFGAGPAWITSGDTGGVILNDLMTIITIVFVFASFLLPFPDRFRAHGVHRHDGAARLPPALPPPRQGGGGRCGFVVRLVHRGARDHH